MGQLKLHICKKFIVLPKMIHIRRSTKAFTLTELLVVIGIVLMLSASGVAVLGPGITGGVSQKVANLSSLLETARAEAMARNTYVWVGLASEDNGETVYLYAVYSETGTVDDLLNGRNLRP
jgi:prepilin-type N-terminal cleavage/methylation domain-containing protein